MVPSSPLLVALVSVSLVSVVTGQISSQASQVSGETLSWVLKPELTSKNEALCKELVKEPFFEAEMVVGGPWRVVYMWNMELGSTCIDLKFKIATPMIIRRFYYDMHEYLEEQPAWGAASLLLRMGKSRREILLFDDQGPVGKFIAVPNVLRDGSQHPFNTPMRYTVPLMKFQMKLTRDGKYLIFMDCQVGLASIAVRSDHPPNRKEIQSVADTLGPDFGTGYHACVPNKDDFKP